MSRLARRLLVRLSEEDFVFLKKIIDEEKDSAANVVRRLIRSKYKRLFSPKPPSLRLSLPSGGGFSPEGTKP